jgi:hypothetical protein
MSRIGARGFWETVKRHWNGDPKAYVDYLISTGLAATGPCAENGAFVHDRHLMRARAQLKNYAHAHPHWRPRSPPDEDQAPF